MPLYTISCTSYLGRTLIKHNLFTECRNGDEFVFKSGEYLVAAAFVVEQLTKDAKNMAEEIKGAR